MPWTFYNASGQKLSSKGKVPVADLANGTDGELITWGTDAVATTVAAGTSGHVLTSGGADAVPSFAAAPALQSTEVEGSRTASAGTGAQAITGAGFAPSAMIIFAVDKVSTFGSFGWGDDAAGEAMIESDAGSYTQTSGRLVTVYNSSGGVGFLAVLTSMDADGCTITWTKLGAGLDVHYIILFLR